jgi:hypothetical protein
MKVLPVKKAEISFGRDESVHFGSPDKHLSLCQRIPIRDGQKDQKRRLLKCVANGCKARTTKWCKA